MHISELATSKYLKQSDAQTPKLLTISHLAQEEVGSDGDSEIKWVMYFQEEEKGLVLNSTNGQLAARALGSEESDDWIGHKIVLYVDPNVSFGGKVVGGLRLRAPKGQAAAAAKPSPARQNPVGDMDDDIPF